MSRRSSLSVALAACNALGAAACAEAQSPAVAAPPVALGWAVDTSATPVREIVRTVLAYTRLPDRGRAPTPFWVADEQAAARRAGPGAHYDLAPEGLYDGDFPATVVGVVPVTPDSARWVVHTLYAKYDSASRTVQPLALHRLYARRVPAGGGAPFGWQLAGALGERTRDWLTYAVGPLVYHVAPSAAFHEPRVRAALAFVDSVAARVGVPRPARIDYYLASTWQEVQALTGLDWYLSATGFAGRAYAPERVVLSGHPGFGEAYRHELAHVVLEALGPSTRQHRLVVEGMATWVAGSGRWAEVGDSYRHLAEYQRANLGLTLAAFLKRFDAQAAYYATGAVVTDAAVRRHGTAGLRRLAAVGPTDAELLAALPALIGVSAGQLDTWWRTEAARLASKP